MKEYYKSKFRNYNSLFKKCILASQVIQNKKYIDSNSRNPSAIWNTIKSNITNNHHKNDIECIKFDDIIYNDPTKICDIFNNFYINMTKNNHSSNNNNFNITTNNTNTIFLTPVTTNEIYNIIMTLNNTKCSGYDDINTKVIKLCAIKLSLPISHVINLSFEQGVFPDKLKLSVVKPLYKKGDPLDPNNYRPITCTTIISKIMEKAMLKRLNSFFEKHNILHDHQYGFRKGSSTTLACYHLVKTISEGLNGKSLMASIFLDMSKAFDFVNHKYLLQKLDKCGIRGNAHKWLKSYLSNRMQCTEIGKITKNKNVLIKQKYRSKFMINNTGVPQGSILGPLLFLVYINDLPNSTQYETILFADDTTIVIKCHDKNNYEQTINTALNDVIEWLGENDLHINTNKTNILQFRSYNTNPQLIQIKYDNQIINEVDNVKFLGFMIDKHLNWKGHIDAICKKLSRFIYALKRLRQTISVEAALTAYHGYVSSVLGYGLLLWGNAVDVKRVLILQKKCIRSICNAKFRDSCKPLFQKLNILPIPCAYIKDICCFVKSHPEQFPTRSEISIRTQRSHHGNKLYQPPCKTMIYEKNVSNMCIVIYNNLPEGIKLLNGFKFKKSLTTWLNGHCFYSVKEYLDNNY